VVELKILKFNINMKNYLLATALIIAINSLCSCNYGRMSDQESLRPYEQSMPDMPEGTVPVTGSLEAVKEMPLYDFKNPIPFNHASFERGRQKYAYFCIMCHGAKADGYGNVGQSFYPLPADLTLPMVQSRTDGELFYSISFGFNRHPPLAYTVSESDRWEIINYIRSLGTKINPLSYFN
jgi:mono/diheme cytochrome c family protein